MHSLRTLRVEQPLSGVGFSIWTAFQSPPSPALRDLHLSFLWLDEERQGKEGRRNRQEFAKRMVDYCAERNMRGCGLERLIIEAPMELPSDLTSLLAHYVDHFEVREEVLSDGDIRTPEFGSSRVFNSVRAVR